MLGIYCMTMSRSCKRKGVLANPRHKRLLRGLIRKKHFPESKTRPRILKHFPQSGFWKVFLNSGTCFGFRVVFLDSGKCFGFWAVFLDSGTCFWILGRVLDSGKCFVLTSHRRLRHINNLRKRRLALLCYYSAAIVANVW